MNKRQRKKLEKAEQERQKLERLLKDIEQLTEKTENLQTRLIGYIADLNRILNQQKVFTDYYKEEVEKVSKWRFWRESLPRVDGNYIVIQKNLKYGFVKLEKGIYKDGNNKTLTAKQLNNIALYLYVLPVPNQYLDIVYKDGKK